MHNRAELMAAWERGRGRALTALADAQQRHTFARNPAASRLKQLVSPCRLRVVTILDL